MELKFKVGDRVALNESASGEEYVFEDTETLQVVKEDHADPMLPYRCKGIISGREDWVEEECLKLAEPSEALRSLNQELGSNNNELIEKLREAEKTIEKLQDNLGEANLTIKALDDDVKWKNLELQKMDEKLRRFKELSDSMYNLAVTNIQY